MEAVSLTIRTAFERLPEVYAGKREIRKDDHGAHSCFLAGWVGLGGQLAPPEGRYT